MDTRKITRKRESEKRVVKEMILLYCDGMHPRAETPCETCQALIDYAHARIDRCPRMDDKTFCTACVTHCYEPAMQTRMRLAMRYSGPRMFLVHPVMAIRHLITRIRTRRRVKHTQVDIDEV